MEQLINGLSKQCTLISPWHIFSSQSLWEDFRIEKYRFPAMYLPVYTSTKHTLLFNLGEPVVFSCKTDSKWRKHQGNNGFIIELLSPGETSEIQWETEFYALQLSIDPAFVNKLLETTDFRFKEQFNVSDPKAADILFKICEEIENGNSAERVYLESLMLSFAIHVVSTYPESGKKIFAPKGKLSAGQLKQVIDFTRSCIHSNISLTQLAACANLSAFHFARLFRQTVGISPYQFVLQMKIEYSKKLIKQHNGSISDIAYVLNFTDQAHFSNAFKKVTGICPRQFLQASVA